MSDRVTVGVVGLGYWGPNLARNFDRLAGADLRWLCDSRPEIRERHAAAFPRTRFTGEQRPGRSAPSSRSNQCGLPPSLGV